jgi:cystathionine beta-lyase
VTTDYPVNYPNCDGGHPLSASSISQGKKMIQREKNPVKPAKIETILTHEGRSPADQHGFVNTPVTRGSTVVFETLELLENGTQAYRYGRTGNPNSASVEEPMTELEGAEGTVLTPSGLSAISIALLSCLASGDELLVTDNAYQPTRNFCDNVLRRMGISVRYFDPRVGADIAEMFTPKTRAIFTECPGSLTFELSDLPAIVGAARQHDIVVLNDNTWATPLYYRPLELGADIVVHAGTKMIIGHSDAMFGTISANARCWDDVKNTHRAMGICVAPDDCYLAARGLRTLALRMKEHEARALHVARWLEAQEGVRQVIHPALETHPDHAIFQRDFSGSGSLFSLVLEPAPREALAAMTNSLAYFGMGYSWGGFESLILPSKPHRTVTPWTEEGNLVRLHIGFEDVDDLTADLDAGLKRYLAAR